MKYDNFNESNKKFDEDELSRGIKIESEHEDLYNYINDYLKSNDISMPFPKKEFYTWIAKAHLREIPDYYTRLKKMEKYAENK